MEAGGRAAFCLSYWVNGDNDVQIRRGRENYAAARWLNCARRLFNARCTTFNTAVFPLTLGAGSTTLSRRALNCADRA